MKKSNVRHLTTALAAAAFLASSPSSSALGIGEMHLQSALNQNLKADISLVLAEGEKGSDFQISFAPNAKFDEAGIPWTLFLSKVKFKTITENGNTVIKLSSTEVLKEPFLDFLLEIKGSKGTLYREFTVLVDPPMAYQSIESLPESTPKLSELPQRFVSAPTPFSSTGRTATTSKSKQKSKPVSRVHHASAIKHVHEKEKSPKIPVMANPLTGDTPKVAPKVTSITKTSVEPVAQQKVIELEKQVTIAEKDAQIVALKAPKVVTNTAEIPPVNLPESVTPKSPAIPIIALPPEAPTLPAMTPETAVAVLPPPVPSIIVPPAPVTTPTPVSSITFTPENNFGIPIDLYYYIAGGTGSLLLGLLGWLRLRARKTPPIITPEIVPETQKNDTDEPLDNDSKTTDALDEIFDNGFDMNAADFDELSFSGLSDFATNDADKHNVDDILYKADVYCSYGNIELAEKLLYNEFTKRPDTHDYALRLLKLYVQEENKSEFKKFVFELAKLGKNDLPEFWTQVSDLASGFYPEALFFMPPPAVPDPLTAIPFNEMFASVSPNEKFGDDSIDFDSMNFDDTDEKEIIFGELTEEETLSSEAPDFLKSSVPGGFEMSEVSELEALTLEMPVEKEPEMDLDFGSFSMGETSEPEALTLEMPVEKEPEMDLDFGSFSMGETSEPEALTFEMPVEKEPEVDLDFGSFSMGEVSEPEALTFEIPVEKEPEVELDFGSFSMSEVSEPEALTFEMPTEKEPEMELDFGNFSMGEVSESEALTFEIPVEKEPVEDLDFSGFAFAVGEALEPEAVVFEKEPTVELDFSAFSMNEPLEPEVLVFEKPAPIKRSLNFEKVSHLVEENVAQTYFDLAKVHNTEEVQLDYLEMSDSQFAESLAAEVLKKCKIKEQLCRQKIAQEVLSKLC